MNEIWILDPEKWPNIEAYQMNTKTSVTQIRHKLRGFSKFCKSILELVLQGTDKYTGAEKDKSETIDILPMIFGAEGYRTYVLADITKRVIRYKNEQRPRDLLKIALWCYLLWLFDCQPEKVGNAKSTNIG